MRLVIRGASNDYIGNFHFGIFPAVGWRTHFVVNPLFGYRGRNVIFGVAD